MGKRLYVGNLSFHTTDSALQQYFTTAGAVESVTLLVDKFTGRSRGIAFVEMATETDAQSAISQFDGKEFDGRALKVNEARPREERAPSGFGGGGSRGGDRRDSGRRNY